MFKRTLLFLIIILITVAIVGCGNNNDNNSEEAAAIVNDEVISVTELDAQVQNQLALFEQQGMDISEQEDEIIDELQIDVLNSLISQKLVAQAANDYSTVSEEEIEKEIALIKENSNIETEKQYNEALAAEGLTHEMLVKTVEESLRQKKFVSEKSGEINVSETELEELFDKYNEMMDGQLDFEDIKPMLEEEVRNKKLVEELKEQADIEILI